MSLISTTVLGAGLSGLVDGLRDDWIGPAFLIIIMILALIAGWKREWRGLAGLVAIGIVVGLFIFAGDDLFGGKDATLTGVGVDTAKEINVISPPFNLLGK